MILHMDMDAFFAAIEQRDDPKLAGQPVVVGGNGRRSVVATASYDARRFGIHSAMPMFMALQRCPHLIVVQSDRAKYAAVSKQIMAILKNFSPVLEQVSIDEAFLDTTGCERLLGNTLTIALAVKEKIKKDTGLTCSVGASRLKFLAKIASDINKPDGIHIIEQEDEPRFLRTLAIKKIPGVGKCAMEQMNRLGIQTLGDINLIPPAILKHKFGKLATRLLSFAKGIDPSRVNAEGPRKSISRESTLENDTSDITAIKRVILAHSQEVGRDLRKRNLLAANVTIKLKFSDFTEITRQHTLPLPISSSAAIYREALLIIGKTPITKKIRLLGVGVSSFSNPDMPVQMEMFENVEKKEEKWDRVDRTMDQIFERFGSNIIKKAALHN